jgi:hypothetical protein
MAELKTRKVNAHWTLLEKNDGAERDEEPGLVIVFWNEKKKEWGKFLPLEDVKASLDSSGKSHLEVR